jgi:hypothetical protein
MLQLAGLALVRTEPRKLKHAPLKAKKMAGGLPCRPTTHFTPKLTYTVNEVPQPQLRVACGFWNTKPRRIRSS